MEVWKLGSGEMVTDRPNSHLHEGVQKVLSEALSRIESAGRDFFETEVVFDRVIGRAECVETKASDKVVWAVRPRRKGHTRFVMNRESTETCTLTVILKRVQAGFIIITAHFGRLAPHEPWDPYAGPQSRPFWDKHALIWNDSTPIVEGTLTEVCPWA